MEPIIEFEKFTFKYRSQVNPTLFDIDLKIYPGEKVLIVGPSGSGKSTLADCINGLIPFSYPGESTGTLKIGGKDPKKLGIFGLSKMVGTVLQDTDGQFIGLTVAEDIAFVLDGAAGDVSPCERGGGYRRGKTASFACAVGTFRRTETAGFHGRCHDRRCGYSFV